MVRIGGKILGSNIYLCKKIDILQLWVVYGGVWRYMVYGGIWWNILKLRKSVRLDIIYAMRCNGEGGGKWQN